jgi:flagellar biosynthesis/type III secretory pathway protein FliH
MTSSSNAPRAVKSDATRAVPVSWAPTELAGTPAARSRMTRGAEHDSSMVSAAELERAVQDAYQRGYTEGLRAGESAEGGRLRHAMAALQDALTSVQEGAERWVGNAEENLAALAVGVARQIVGRELTTDPEIVTELVRRAMADFPIGQPLTVRLHPSDLHAVSAAIAPSNDGSLGLRNEVTWIGDGRIAPGGCFIEGRERIVDGRVDTALERLYRRMSYTGA